MARQVSDAAATAMLIAAGAVTADGTAVGAAVGAAGGATEGAAVLQRLRDSLNEQRCLSLKSAPRPLAQVLLAADYMGLPYGGDHGTDLLWIADAFLCPQLPFGWEEFPSDDGPAYYQNLWTGECMWEHPQRAFLRGVAEAAATLRAAQQKVDAAPQP